MHGRFLPLLPATLLLATSTAVYSAPAESTMSTMSGCAGYADYQTYRAELRRIAASPEVRLESLAKTAGGRDVYLLTITSGDRSKADSKPAILIVGSAHAPHLLGSELATRLAGRLAERAETDKEIAGLLDRFTFYVIPRPSPDASEAFLQRPLVQRDVNLRPTDDDGDGALDEDGPDDLDGNGVITMMRVQDGAGSHILHPADDRLLLQADPERNERGRWSLFSEGRDNDGDEEINEDPPGGVAFDRNFTFEYPYFQPGAGPHQVSEPETRAVADFAFDHANIGLVWTFTPRDNLINPWPSDEGDASGKLRMRAADGPYFNDLAEAYQAIHGEAGASETPPPDGGFSAWAYFHYGRWSLACRGWSPPEPESEPDEGEREEDEGKPDQDQSKGEGKGEGGQEEEEAEDEKDDRLADEQNALAWFDREGIDGFVAWRPIDHPDFPGKRVEVGGFRPFVRLNPPAKEIEPLAGKQWEFLQEVTKAWPRLEIADMRAETLEAGVWRVTVSVVNQGRLPSMSEMGRVTGQPQPVQLELRLPKGFSLLTGHPRHRIGPLAGEGGRAERTWLVVGPKDRRPTIRVRAWSPSVGGQSKSLSLQR